MCVCVFVYMCLFVSTFLFVSMCVLVYMCVLVHMPACTCVCMCVHVCLHWRRAHNRDCTQLFLGCRVCTKGSRLQEAVHRRHCTPVKYCCLHYVQFLSATTDHPYFYSYPPTSVLLCLVRRHYQGSGMNDQVHGTAAKPTMCTSKIKS